jgi:hypothetical protein
MLPPSRCRAPRSGGLAQPLPCNDVSITKASHARNCRNRQPDCFRHRDPCALVVGGRPIGGNRLVPVCNPLRSAAVRNRIAAAFGPGIPGRPHLRTLFRVVCRCTGHPHLGDGSSQASPASSSAAGLAGPVAPGAGGDPGRPGHADGSAQREGDLRWFAGGLGARDQPATDLPLPQVLCSALSVVLIPT